MNLVEVLPTLSWRRFVALIRGLSPNSAYVTIQQSKQKGNKPKAEVIEDDKAGEDYVSKMFGG